MGGDRFRARRLARDRRQRRAEVDWKRDVRPRAYGQIGLALEREAAPYDGPLVTGETIQMKLVSEIQVQLATSSFLSTDHATPVRQVLFDGRLFANAELTDWSAGELQVEICESCGRQRCVGEYCDEKSLWVRPRRFHGPVTFLPTTEAMSYATWDWDAYAYLPSILQQDSLTVLAAALYGDLQKQLPGIPHFDDLTPLCADDLADILRWEAHCYALNDAPKPIKLEPDSIMAVDTGKLSNRLRDLKNAIEQIRELGSTVVADCKTDEGDPIAFFASSSTLDEFENGGQPWRPIFERSGSIGVFVEPGFRFPLWTLSGETDGSDET